jgi:hypothetical protein
LPWFLYKHRNHHDRREKSQRCICCHLLHHHTLKYLEVSVANQAQVDERDELWSNLSTGSSLIKGNRQFEGSTLSFMDVVEEKINTVSCICHCYRVG